MKKSLEQRQAEMRERLPKPRTRTEKAIAALDIAQIEPNPVQVLSAEYRENDQLTAAWQGKLPSEELKTLAEGGGAKLIADHLMLTASGMNSKARTADAIKAADIVMDRIEGKAISRSQNVSIQVSPEVMERLTAIAEKLAKQ